MSDLNAAANTRNNIWKTGISQAYWCHAGEKKCDQNAFEPAIDLSGIETNLSWFDRMLEGGIVLPETSYNPLTILLTGPPGSGKTTFALELAYRLIHNKIDTNSNHDKNNTLDLNQYSPKKCLYISIESTSKQIINKVKCFKWRNYKNVFSEFKKNLPQQNEKVIVYGVENIRGNNIKKITKNAINSINEGKRRFNHYAIAIWLFIIGLLINLTHIPNDVRNFFIISAVVFLLLTFIITPRVLEYFSSFIKIPKPIKEKSFMKFAKRILKYFSNDTIDILVVDSLNSLHDEKSKGRAFTKFLNSIHGKAKVVLFLLDADKKPAQAKFWEYICDTVIRLDSETQSGYWLRTIEIEKARYQRHVQGKQILKIEPGISNSKNQIPCYSHPYRIEGGLFIFPSIHYYLSYYKKHLSKTETDTENMTKQEYAKLYPYSLNKLIKKDSDRGLIPVGRCTAFVGQRGGHKSHLGYIFLLHQMINMQESALVISLRDDKEMTRKAMITILNQEEELLKNARKQDHLRKKDAALIIKWFEDNGRLEILYYHPGYITPEEFCHRMLMSSQHIKHDGLKKNQSFNKNSNCLPDGNWEKLTVLFNSLDQLTSRFPLCTKQDIFVPGLIDTLSGENVTSIFVAVNTDDQPDDQYGLMSMADLIFSFKPLTFQLKEYSQQLLQLNNKNNTIIPLTGNNEAEYETIEIEIKRFAGGEKAGAKGTLELINGKNNPLYPIYEKTGLQFNQIYKKTNRRKYERKEFDKKRKVRLQKSYDKASTIDVILLNLSSAGMCINSESIELLNNIINDKKILIRPDIHINPLSGEFKWLHYKEDSIVAGIKFNREVDTNLFVN